MAPIKRTAWVTVEDTVIGVPYKYYLSHGYETREGAERFGDGQAPRPGVKVVQISWEE